VPCCSPCNNEKQQKPWEQFLTHKSPERSEDRIKLIWEFVESKSYDPNLNLHEFADNLYEEVGEVAMTLIDLRYKQAQEGIKKLLV
jgi:hypothetical protein|tara:strand:- start:424 stop:681 length:258 start_codon:yes stop_codon:yes gene_type:complete